jgi:hypothetical protein
MDDVVPHHRNDIGMMGIRFTTNLSLPGADGIRDNFCEIHAFLTQHLMLVECVLQ